MPRPNVSSKSITFRAEPPLQEAIELYRSINDISTTQAIKELLGNGILVFLNNMYREEDEEVTK